MANQARRGIRSRASRVWRWVLVAMLVPMSVALIGAVVLFVQSNYTPISPHPTQGLSAGVLLDMETGAQTAYWLEILSYDTIEANVVKKWIDSKRDKGSIDQQPVYYTLYNDDFDAPMEMYLYMPDAQEVIGDLTLSDVKVKVDGKALVLSIETSSHVSRTKDGADLILHVYVTGAPEDATAKTDTLIINGEHYHCPGASFTPLHRS